MIGEIYSKRKRRLENADQVEVYEYNDLPLSFRRQVLHIWLTAIGDPKKPLNTRTFKDLPRIWKHIHDSLCRELGRFQLSDETQSYPVWDLDPLRECQVFLIEEKNIDNVLSLIEVTFREIDSVIRFFLKKTKDAMPDRRFVVAQSPEDAISELNYRFREHAIGYQYSNGQIIRVDSSFIHSEAVVPALSLLSSQGFEGAEQEFRDAHRHYRIGEYRDAIVDAQNAFESTIKTICDRCDWPYSRKAAAKELISVVLDKELIPKYFQDHLTSLQKVLENGVPTVRNKTSGHGQGELPINVPDYLAAFALHLTASNIVLLVEAYESFGLGNSPSLND